MINHEFTSGAGLGFTEFCINIPWASFSVLLANLLAEHASWRWPNYIAIIYSSSVLMVKDPSPYLTNHVAVHMEKEVLGRGRVNDTDIVELN
jgi:hypothetical protein